MGHDEKKEFFGGEEEEVVWSWSLVKTFCLLWLPPMICLSWLNLNFSCGCHCVVLLAELGGWNGENVRENRS